MKRAVYILSLLFLVTACDKGSYKINGVHKAVPDGTVMYLSPYVVFDVDDILVPVDSAVVKNGCFKFFGTQETPGVYFVSSSRVIDGGFVVVEPGKAHIDLTGRTSRHGTPGNELLDRFLNEKEKIIAMRGLCDPAILPAIAQTQSVRDSVATMLSLAEMVFDLYVSKAIEENIENDLGHFMLTQSVGIASPEKLAGFFERVPERLRDKMYESRLAQLNRLWDAQSAKENYMENAYKAVQETSVGKKYLNFEMDEISGGKRLFSDIVADSEYTVLCFWGAWSENSLAALCEIDKMASPYVKDGLSLVTVSLDKDVEECRKALSKNDISGTHLCNPEGGSAEVASAYGIYELPHALIINKEGTVLLRTASADDVKSKLAELF